MDANQILGLRSLFETDLDNPDLEIALCTMASMMRSLQDDLDQAQRQMNKMAEYMLSWQEVA